MLLDAHPALAIPPETHFVPGLCEIWRRSAGSTEAVKQALLADPRWPDFGIDAARFLARATTARIDGPAGLLRLFYATYAESLGKPRWGDKTPPYVLHMPTIAAVLPEARFIHIIRDGRDVALSVRPLWFGPNSIEEAAYWWRARVHAGRADGQHVAYTEVLYEDLVNDPEPHLTRLCAFIGLGFDPVMLTSHRSAGTRLRELHDNEHVSAITRRGILARVSSPVTSERVGRWCTEMMPSEQDTFDAIAGDVLAELGYSRGR
jgi:hypothetical protein